MAESVFPLLLSQVTLTVGAHTVLRDIDLSIEETKRTVILGANGAGKSVLMRVMHGLISPSAGTITWAGNSNRPSAQAMVFQRPVMLRRSAQANVAYGLRLRRVAPSARLALVGEVLARISMQQLASRPARVLSTGEQQKLALARAWVLSPRLLFLDEPTANLDPNATQSIESIITEIHADGSKVIMTTHNLGQARRLADEIIFVHEGRVMEHTPADIFFRQPRSVEAAQFIRAEQC